MSLTLRNRYVARDPRFSRLILILPPICPRPQAWLASLARALILFLKKKKNNKEAFVKVLNIFMNLCLFIFSSILYFSLYFLFTFSLYPIIRFFIYWICLYFCVWILHICLSWNFFCAEYSVVSVYSLGSRQYSYKDDIVILELLKNSKS